MSSNGSANGNRTFVIGVGMTKFEKPETREWDYPQMAKEAGTKALEDAGVAYEDIEQAFAGYCYGESTSGQRALYELGLTGIPVVNVNNNCSTGSTALYMARQAVKGGLADCALAIGFEKMSKGSLGATFMDREQPTIRHLGALAELYEPTLPPAPYMFGAAGVEHMQRYGSEPDHFAWIGWKNHKHSTGNPYAQFQTEYSLEEIKEAKVIYEPLPLTRLQCSPTSDGSGAAVIASERFLDAHPELAGRAVEIVAQAMVTDTAETFEDRSAISVVGAKMSKKAAQQVYEEAGFGPDAVEVCELHDCFSANELITYEALGFAEEGEGHKLVDAEATTYGGEGPVVNPSGGLISKGHPLGATGLAQCSELTWQLRGEADDRQVDGAKVALQHNIGLGGAVVVTAYKPASNGG
jgi:acetyl-CoA acyltransferase